MADAGATISRFDGHAWSTSLTLPSGASSLAVSCSSSSFCMELEALWSPPGTLSPTIRVRRYVSGMWSGPQVLGTGAGGAQDGVIACHSRGFCLAALQPETLSVSYTDAWIWAHGSWTEWPSKWGTTGWPGGVACPTASFCRYVENYPQGNAFTYAQGHWFLRHVNIRGCADSSEKSPCPAFQDLSCPTTRFCVGAVGSHWVYVYRSEIRWRPAWVDPTPDAYLDAISCPATTFCLAGANRGQVIFLTGRRWSKPVQIDARRTYFAAVSCATARFCVAVDSRGRAFIGR